MKFTATQIAELLEGDIVGDPNVEVSKLAKIEEGTEGALTFLSNEKYTSYIYTTNASLAIVNKSFEPTKEISATLIKVDDAYAAFTKLLTFYNEVKQNKSGKEEPHFVSDSAEIGINIYFKKGDIKDITEASDQLNIQALTKPVVKYFICYPKK